MDVEKFKEKIADFDSDRNKMAFTAFILTVLVLFSASFVANNYLESDMPEEENKTPELTKYQRNYVDCPPKYLDLCTKMSQKPTEEVKFDRVEDNRLYLKLPRTDRMMVVKLVDGEEEGRLIRIKS